MPIVLLGYDVAARWHRRAVVAWLALSSLAFYGYWKPAFLVLLCGSILFNYLAGLLISRRIPNHVSQRAWLWTAICANLAVLCYYKYLFPSLNGIAQIFRSPRHWTDVVLPLGISFFTFTQIAYLVDLSQGSAEQQDLDSYVLFVTFFPHLIAGPILHHAEMMPQWQSDRDFRLRADDLAVGFSYFVMGLFKKVILADRFAKDADAAFWWTYSLHAPQAWIGVLAYSLQLYFDFSGYSDMALGLARMFGIEFPLNFASPYKSMNIIDFWQRWHMTLTRYIMTYLYNPISLSVARWRMRHGRKMSRKAMATPSGFLSIIAYPTTVTLFLAGVWHGAGKQFVVFGLLHAMYLSVNHAWRVYRGARQAAEPSVFARRAGQVGSLLLTYAAVLVAQVFFRAPGVRSAAAMLAGMAGAHGHADAALSAFHPGVNAILRLLGGYLIVWCMPNTQQILARFRPALELAPSDKTPSLIPLRWVPTPAWGMALGVCLVLALIKMEDPSTFLYFQF